ncbi:MAG: thiamine-phosphate kinase [Candidatus Omnitrophota bacterium]
MSNNMKLKDIGEFGFIDILKKKFKSDSSVVCSIGDDAAVIKYNKNEYLLFASDMIVEDVHFKIKSDKNIFFKIGHKALACNISDIAAMGGVSKYIVVNMGVNPDFNKADVLSVFSGMNKLAKKFGVNIIGGDFSKSDKLTVSIAIIGVVKKKQLVLRSGAQAGDIIFVTGLLGGSGAGKHMVFMPRVKESMYLVNKYKINAMIDISDGLARDLRQITEASKKGAILREELLPISPSAKSIEDTLYEGEDFELLFTADAKTAAKLKKDKKIKVHEIGRITADRKKFAIVLKSGAEKKLAVKGFRHF